MADICAGDAAPAPSLHVLREVRGMVAVRFLQICAAGRLDTALACSLGRLLMKQSSLTEVSGALTCKMQQKGHSVPRHKDPL